MPAGLHSRHHRRPRLRHLRPRLRHLTAVPSLLQHHPLRRLHRPLRRCRHMHPTALLPPPLPPPPPRPSPLQRFRSLPPTNCPAFPITPTRTRARFDPYFRCRPSISSWLCSQYRVFHNIQSVSFMSISFSNTNFFAAECSDWRHSRDLHFQLLI